MGLSASQLNWVLRELRHESLVTFQRGKVTIHHFHRLADFDKSYLYQDGPLMKGLAIH